VGEVEEVEDGGPDGAPEVEPVLVDVAEGFDCPSEGTFADPEDCSRWDRELDWTGFN
jgi:hypothetical protein